MGLLFLFVYLPLLVYGRIEQDVMPQFLEDCYSNIPSRMPGKLEKQTTCLEQYLRLIHNNVTSLRMDQTAIDWIEMLGQKLHVRLKRQAEEKRGRGGNGNGNRYSRLRVRKEIRTLNNRELANFFNAVNALKRDKSVLPNKYDAFAIAHQGDATAGAHRGPNFVSWHRYMLVLFEDALRTKGRSVTIPYWDSRVDFRMSRPEDTILFSEVLMGNGVGVVYNGPFALWETPAENTLLRRNIPGPRSSLVNPERLKSMFTKRYHREILNPTAATPDDNLEDHHDGVHRWVGGSDGHMGDLLLSPMDPIFYLHHCFIDYLWERFRERQKKLGINSETDYPPTTIPLHGPNDIMANLKPDRKNIWGYSNHFTRTIYRYADEPKCSNRCGRGRNVFLYCDRKQKACVSRSRIEFLRGKGFKDVDRIYAKGGKTQILSRTDSIAPPGVEAEIAPAPTSMLAARDAVASRNPAPRLTSPFAANIVDDRTVARKRRSLDFHMLDGNVSNTSYAFKSLNRFDDERIAISPVVIKTYSKQATLNQASIDSSDPTYNITFETVGFSYDGIYADHVLLDHKSKSAESIGLIAFDKPIDRATSTFVRAYDSNGNICQANCLTSDLTYTDCTGMLKITPDQPLMYKDVQSAGTTTMARPFLKFDCQK